MKSRYKLRRTVTLLVIVAAIVLPIFASRLAASKPVIDNAKERQIIAKAFDKLALLEVKGRAPKTGYARTQFGDGWADYFGCNMRDIILGRDMNHIKLSAGCNVMSGELNDPYTATVISFQRGPTTSDKVQIDHVVALSNAWQTGAQLLPLSRRIAFANDPLNLLAVQGKANQDKLDGDAATWLPPNEAFRCQYVARQIEVKAKYSLWLTPAEQVAIEKVLRSCMQ